MIRLQVAAVLLCVFFSSSLRAGLVLGTNGPHLMDPGTTSGSLLASAINESASPPASDNLSAWQLILQIVPDSGTQGTLEFSSVSLPSGYLLSGINAGLSSTISTTVTSNDSVSASDFNSPFTGGVPVPVAPGGALLDMYFTALASAVGTFGVYAIPGTGFTEWADAVPQTRQFTNVPLGGPNVRIGQVTVVPEPSAFLMVLLVMVAVYTTSQVFFWLRGRAA